MEKLIIPENTNSKKVKAPKAHNDSLDKPKSSSSRRPLLVRIKLGSSTVRLVQTDKAEENGPVETGSNSPDNKSTGNDNYGSDTKFSSSCQPTPVQLKLGPAEKPEENKLVQQKSGADDDNGSNKKPTGDDNAVSDTKNLPSKEGKKGVHTCEKNQEVPVVLIYKFFHHLKFSLHF
jgi:hypothetical protein